jgi:anti-sigma regulatory factor (Ser/Thr protein kinase)
MRVSSDPRILCVVRGAMHALAKLAGFKEKDCRGVTLAVDEALANIMRHAYLSRMDQPIDISCHSLQLKNSRIAKSGIEIILLDHGIVAKRGALHPRPLDEVRPGGLGLHFMCQSMDQVAYKRIGKINRLRMVKYIK